MLVRYADSDASLLEQLSIARQWMDFIKRAAGEGDCHPSIILAIGSRESLWGLALRPKGPAGTGDWCPRGFKKNIRKSTMPDDGLGFGRGLLQIDYDAHEFARIGPWQDPEQNIIHGGRVLGQSKRFLELKLKLPERDLLRAAIAGYNCGPGNVLKAAKAGMDVDAYTAHKNYSADVLARAAWFRRHVR
ncbi:MAG: hypothetical protein WC655_03290 [Candidatus Hydrogenedentales bacterium]|jgi:hypothetical protein